MKENKLSIKDVARLAGVSVATVSRVINQNGRFSKETERKVLDIIEQYNYRPNELARGLRVHKAQVIGVIVPDITNEFFAHIVKKIENELIKKGYMAMICDTNDEVELEGEYIEMLKALQIGGIIYVSGDQKINPIENIPAVYIDRQPNFADSQHFAAFIGSDNRQGGYIATKRLLEAGKKKIAIVLQNKAIATQEYRLNGYIQALKEAGQAYDESLVRRVDFVNEEQGYQATHYICEEIQDVDGIFYSSDRLAIGGLKYFYDRKISVPEQIAVIGFDDIPQCTQVVPNLTTVHQHYMEFGELAADTIIRMIHSDTGYSKHILPVELVERETV